MNCYALVNLAGDGYQEGKAEVPLPWYLKRAIAKIPQKAQVMVSAQQRNSTEQETGLLKTESWDFQKLLTCCRKRNSLKTLSFRKSH